MFRAMLSEYRISTVNSMPKPLAHGLHGSVQRFAEENMSWLFEFGVLKFVLTKWLFHFVQKMQHGAGKNDGIRAFRRDYLFYPFLYFFSGISDEQLIGNVETTKSTERKNISRFL